MPEHNLIQVPELLARVAKRFGLKQPHITPTLNDGVQLVAILDDLSTSPTSAVQTYLGTALSTAVAANFPLCELANPVGTGVICRIRRWLYTVNTATQTYIVGAHGPSSTFGAIPVPQTSVRGISTRDARSLATPNPAPYAVSKAFLNSGTSTLATSVTSIVVNGWSQVFITQPVGLGWIDGTPGDITVQPGETFRAGSDGPNALAALAVLWDEEPVQY